MGFMVGDPIVHDGLPGQTEPEVAPGTGHDADASDDVVIDLTPASRDLVDGREK